MKISGIYLITNVKNSKQYVGQSRDIVKRLSSYRHSKRTTAIHLAIEKYGIDNFTFYTLQTEVSVKDLNAAEIFWIKTLNTQAPFGYNLTSGGNSKTIISEETRFKISKSKIGKRCSEETKLKIGKANSGRICTEEHKKKVADAITVWWKERKMRNEGQGV